MIPPPWPFEPKGPDHFHRPGNAYNAMIHPLIPMTMRGVLWYQGEGNVWRAEQYKSLLPALINYWRKSFVNEHLWFLIVQLPAFEADWQEEDVWAEMRESQWSVGTTTPHTATVVTLGVGDPHDIHAPQKAEIGRRVANTALKLVYGRDVFFCGPVFVSLTKENNCIRIRFTVHNSLATIGTKNEVEGFLIADNNQNFEPAMARIDGNDCIVWSKNILNPVAVRYAWANNPTCNLCDNHGLPAVPFRTDDWPLRTQGRLEPEAICCYPAPSI